jgi:hypothetical protein
VLTDAKNSELYADWLNFIEVPETRAAFCYIVGIAASSKRYSCHIQWKGQVRDFRFHDVSGEQPHAFITNQRWLLFYFRPPAVRSNTYSRDRLAKDFDRFWETPKGEWTVKLRDIADVERLSKHIQWSAT